MFNKVFLSSARILYQVPAHSILWLIIIKLLLGAVAPSGQNFGRKRIVTCREAQRGDILLWLIPFHKFPFILYLP